MNPNANETTGGMQLPAPVEQPAAGAVAGGMVEAAPAAPEQAAIVGQNAPVAQPTQLPPVPPIALPLPPIVPQTTTQIDVTVTTQNPGPTVLDDSDLIEKEWVDKAKQIVERNRDDPYKQSEELTVFKADYMKKRYDKSIKLNQ